MKLRGIYACRIQMLYIDKFTEQNGCSKIKKKTRIEDTNSSLIKIQTFRWSHGYESILQSHEQAL